MNVKDSDISDQLLNASLFIRIDYCASPIKILKRDCINFLAELNRRNFCISIIVSDRRKRWLAWGVRVRLLTTSCVIAGNRFFVTESEEDLMSEHQRA